MDEIRKNRSASENVQIKSDNVTVKSNTVPVKAKETVHIASDKAVTPVKTVIPVAPALPSKPKKKRVAAYARVSLDTEELTHSLSTQVSYYSDLIQRNSAWEYAGVYADKGITGTSTANRSEFNRLMEDCEAGLVDLVLVKSISRFARNTVDCLNAVRHLKDIGVEVRFERENISTFSEDGELMLTLLASFAQEESESLSRNEKWSIQKGFENGESHTSLRSFGYDWDSDTGTCMVNEEEAVWVRYIYRRFLEGASIRKIEKEMKENGVMGLRGKPLGRTTIRRILTSELYVGDEMLQKYYSPKIRNHKLNKGEEPMYLVSDAHQAIVSREDYEKVQELREKRASEAGNYGHQPHDFTGMVQCGKCGRSCCRMKKKRLERNVTIECNRRECDLLPIREYELAEAVKKVSGRPTKADDLNAKAEALNAKADGPSTKVDEPQDIVLFDDHIDITMKSGVVKTVARDFPGGSHTCFTGKIFCSNCGRKFARQTRQTQKRATWACYTRFHDTTACDMTNVYEDELIETAKSVFEEVDREEDREADHIAEESVQAGGDHIGSDRASHIPHCGNYKIRFYEEVEKVIVYKDRFDFIFKRGEIKSWNRE